MSDDDWRQIVGAAEAEGEATPDFIRRVLLKSAKAVSAKKK